jgi:molecular chaperone GrpE (heat shock protein)
MKARQVEEIIRNQGMERGVVYILASLVEQVNQIEKNLNLMAQVQHQMTDTVANVVEGVGGMRSHMISTLRKSGINVDSEEMESDGLGSSTHLIGKQ